MTLSKDIAAQAENTVVEIHHIDAHLSQNWASKEHENNKHVNQAAWIEMAQIDLDWQRKGCHPKKSIHKVDEMGARPGCPNWPWSLRQNCSQLRRSRELWRKPLCHLAPRVHTQCLGEGQVGHKQLHAKTSLEVMQSASGMHPEQTESSQHLYLLHKLKNAVPTSYFLNPSQ